MLRRHIVICGSLLLPSWTTLGSGAENAPLRLKSLTGHPVSFALSDLRATAVVFVSTICPMSVDYFGRLSALQDTFSAQAVRVVLIDSNVNETDLDVAKQARELQLSLPIYRDPGASLADRLKALATPTAILLDSKGEVRYRGSIDDSRAPERVKRPFLRLAIESVLAGTPVAIPRTRVSGCGIKQ